MRAWTACAACAEARPMQSCGRRPGATRPACGPPAPRPGATLHDSTASCGGRQHARRTSHRRAAPPQGPGRTLPLAAPRHSPRLCQHDPAANGGAAARARARDADRSVFCDAAGAPRLQPWRCRRLPQHGAHLHGGCERRDPASGCEGAQGVGGGRRGDSQRCRFPSQTRRGPRHHGTQRIGKEHLFQGARWPPCV